MSRAKSFKTPMAFQHILEIIKITFIIIPFFIVGATSFNTVATQALPNCPSITSACSYAFVQ